MKKIKEIFNYVFYMAYIKEKNRRAGSPLLAGILNVCLVITLYLFIISFIFSIFGLYIFEERNIIIPASIVVSIIVGSINYYIYGYKKKYLKIIEKYRGENEKTKKKNRINVISFIIFSLLLMVVLFIVSVQLYKQSHNIS